MEHVSNEFIAYIRTHLLLLIWITTLCGCNQPIPNPETTDPIYGDLQNEQKLIATNIESEKKTIDELYAGLKKMDVRGPQKKHAMREINAREKHLQELEQQRQYFEIRADQRKLFDTKDYLRAFEAKQPWPNPSEFAEYKNMKKLRSAPKMWDARVPKLTRHLKTPPSGAEKGKKEEKSEPKHE